MAKFTKDHIAELLDLISNMGSYGRAESEPDQGFLRRYLPLPEHARCLDPEIMLVIGDRGAGKTELFRAIQQAGGIDQIAQVAHAGKIPPPTSSKWLVGFSTSGKEFPAELVFRNFSVGKGPGELQIIWMGLLLRSLLKAGVLQVGDVPNDVGVRIADPTVPLAGIHDIVTAHLESIFGSLDRLDSDLTQQDRWAFIIYDELDRVSASDWDQLRTILRGLVQFWASYARRWQRLRPKVFLRRDLFDRVALFGPDVSKIAAQRVELLWTTRNLYALTTKRLVNQDSRIRDYFTSVMPAGEDRGDLGWYPTSKKEEDFRAFVEHMCGKYMGAGPTKGTSFLWIPNHLQDGNGRVLPRSIVRFFECAASIERSNPRADPPRLFHHTALRGAVDQVSVSRVQEIEDEEFPWMKHVRAAVARVHPQVPIERHDLEMHLQLEWDSVAEKAPDRSSRELLRLLIELGIFYQRNDGRIDARDLYLKGFGLRRKGGVKRPY